MLKNSNSLMTVVKCRSVKQVKKKMRSVLSYTTERFILMTNVLISLLILSQVKFLTALQSGGWVPWTSMSFHYWQPAHWWDCSHGRQILATQPRAPMQRGRRAPLTLLIIYNRYSRNKGGCGGGNNPETMLEHKMAVHQTWGIDMPSLAQSMH